MPDLIAVALSIAVPWIGGACAVRAFTRREPQGALLSIGYGYLAGIVATTLVMRLLSLAGIRWTLPLVALPVLALTLIAAWAQWPGRWRESWRVARAEPRTWTSAARASFWVLLALIVIRVADLALEAWLRPVQPWDAWSHWSTKAKVWFEFGRMVPFVKPAEWLSGGALMAFTDQQPGYPATVPLLQVWTNLWLGAWDDAHMNAPWPALLCALAIAFFAQLRRSGVAAPAAMLFTYLLTSLPFLNVHVALAGLADVFLAAAYGMCAIATWGALHSRSRADIVTAAIAAIACATVKIEGTLWLLTLLPGIVVALRRRFGLWLVAVTAAMAVLYLAVGPSRLPVLGYVVQTDFTNVSLPVVQHMFVMDNWHLFWFAVVAVVAVRARRLLDPGIAPMTVTMLAGVAFIVLVFFFSNAAGGVDDETLINRLLLHVVPAMGFYVLQLLLQPTRQVREASATLTRGVEAPASSGA